ncbi:hypothetical protein [Umezawaea tangerina]|uniref:Uncharacterized protein n=1 Tax=Umezawaea tangerina TaxID=84725 RepID=A0A2T0T9G2_9PSEU|nr:hypothetical protein [Umezawaea tangerina]PRY42304.1 hypothetical protein CLV43_104134 [Umezawaea tangerina]
MAFQDVRFPRGYRPVAGAARAMGVSAWVGVVGSLVFAVGAWDFRWWMEDEDHGSPTSVLVLLVGGLLVFLVGFIGAVVCFLLWRRRVRWNAKLVVGAEWSGRRRALSLNDVWNAGDPAQRSAARADRPRNPLFVVWPLSYFALTLVMVAYWYFGRGLHGAAYARFLSHLAVVHVAVALVLATTATLGVHAITRRQSEPAQV